MRVVLRPNSVANGPYSLTAPSRRSTSIAGGVSRLVRRDATRIDPHVLKAASAHLWFVTIHPFDDGNGRIARAIADMALARSEQTAQRFYSMSAQIRRERNAYYDMLEETQKGDLDITRWLHWFLGCLDRAIDAAESVLANVLRKARFWDKHAGAAFNQRQRDMLGRLLQGFEGKLTSSKWAKIQKCSQDTALRDIDDLVGRGILRKDAGGGRSTSYSPAPEQYWPRSHSSSQPPISPRPTHPCAPPA